MLFLLLVSLLKIKALQQLESANRIVENTSCSSMVILALWGFLSNMSRYDSEDRGRTTMLCRKLKNIFYHFFGQHHSQAALPVFHFFFFLNPSWQLLELELVSWIDLRQSAWNPREIKTDVFNSQFFLSEGLCYWRAARIKCVCRIQAGARPQSSLYPMDNKEGHKTWHLKWCNLSFLWHQAASC